MDTETATRILIIDDDPVIRRLLVTCMQSSGYETLEAEDGSDGLRQIREYQPGLVLCDMRMPHVDGLEVLKTARKEAPQMPIIMISGAGLISDVVEALRLGAWDYILKPISNVAVLGHMVQSTLHRANLEQENKQYREQLEATNRELQASLAILREDQEAGRRVQAQLLPNTQGRFGQYMFSHLVIPSLYMSGDFLEYFEIDDRYIGFYIADVSGHGSSSAFVTVILKNLVNQLRKRYQTMGDQLIINPAKVFEYLNSEIIQTQLSKYLTMFYGVLDSRSHILRYCIGGHYPRPIMSDPNDSGFVPGEGLPVGLFDFAEYREETFTVPEHFLLAMFSDGLFEMIDAESLEEKEQYLLNLCAHPDISIASLKEQLHLDRIKGSADDVTVFLLHRRG